MGACELDATLDPADRIEAFHSNEYSYAGRNEKSPLVQGERNQDGRSKMGKSRKIGDNRAGLLSLGSLGLPFPCVGGFWYAATLCVPT